MVLFSLWLRLFFPYLSFSLSLYRYCWIVHRHSVGLKTAYTAYYGIMGTTDDGFLWDTLFSLFLFIISLLCYYPVPLWNFFAASTPRVASVCVSKSTFRGLRIYGEATSTCSEAVLLWLRHMFVIFTCIACGRLGDFRFCMA